MAETQPQSRSRHLVRWFLSLALVVVVFGFVLPRIADISEVWATLKAMTWIELGSLALASAWNLVTYWVLLVVTLPGLTVTQAMMVTEASTAAASILPAGQAVGMALAYRMYASWGFRRPAIALALVVSGVGDLFAKLAIPVLALLFLGLYGEANAALVTASIIGVIVLVAGVALFVLILRSDESASRIGSILSSAVSRIRRRLGREPVTEWGEGMARFRTETIDLMRRRWVAVLSASLLSHISLFVVLLLTLRHVGISEMEVGWAEALGAFAFVRLLAALPLTPGGLGVVELGLTASLVLAGGPEAPVVAAVLLFRALTFVVQIPFGAVTYLLWRHSAGRSATAEPPVKQPTG